jgi:TRAP-type transport system periplasmic protein
MKKSAALLGFMIGLFVVISGWGLVPRLYAAPIEIKIGHGDSPDIYTSRKAASSTVFKVLVETETGGAVEVKIFPAGQIGNEREMTEGVKLGTLQMAMVSGPLANYFKEAQVLDIPYLFSSYPVAWKVLDGWFGKEMAAECLKKTGMRVLSYGQIGFRNFTNSTRAIKSPADLKGMKIRVMESPVYINLIKSMGASPTPIPWTETYTALQQKVADGQENPVTSIKFAKLYEVQKYLTMDGHTYGVDFMLINEKFFQTLPKDTQMIVKNAAVTAQNCGKGIDTIDSTLGIQFLKEKGMEVYSPSAKEKAMFREAAQKPVIEYLEKQIGKTWIDKVMKAVKEAEAEVAKSI